MAHHVDTGDDVRTVARRLAEEAGTSPEVVGRSPHVLIGSPDAMKETLLQHRESYGISYWVILERDIDTVGQVVAELAGS